MLVNILPVIFFGLKIYLFKKEKLIFFLKWLRAYFEGITPKRSSFSRKNKRKKKKQNFFI
jgi:hypothetical protein